MNCWYGCPSKRFRRALVTHEGISWLASQIGTPINKFVRDSLDIKVSVVKDVMEEIPFSLMVVLEGGE
ncbi:hypothetical protein LINPERPRIM_LOCUS38390 [Linum perenne]